MMISPGGIEVTRKYRARTIEELQTIAADNNCDLFICAANQLALDLDTVGGITQMTDMLPFVNELFGVTKEERWASQSGNVHCVIDLKDSVQPLTRILLQALLGSDPKREIIALAELNDGFAESTLFRPKGPTNA